MPRGNEKRLDMIFGPEDSAHLLPLPSNPFEASFEWTWEDEFTEQRSLGTSD